jgi:predicted HAD superfamily Cof-like phosphohydrolase
MTDSVQKTNFEKVMEFNRAFDMVTQEPSEYKEVKYIDSVGNFKTNVLSDVRYNIFKDSPATIKLRLDLIKEEINELQTAIEENDIIEQRDACADILYVVYGMADILGIEINSVFRNNIQNSYLTMFRRYNRAFSTDKHKLYLNLFVDFGNEPVDHLKQITNFTYLKHFKDEIMEEIGLSITKNQIETIGNKISNNIYEYYKILEIICNESLNKDLDNIVNTIYKFEYIACVLYRILKSTYLYVDFLGYDADADFSIVHESNMSKLCDNEEDAIATVAVYEKNYKTGTSSYDSPYYYYLPNLNKWIIKNKSTGKALKNIKYKKVMFI